jgi:hypothetical protein
MERRFDMTDLREYDKRTKDLLEAVRKSQESVLGFGRKCAKAVEEAVPVEMPVTREVVKSAFDLAEEILKAQRDFAYSVIKATSSLGPSHTARAPRRTAAAKKAA